MVLLLEFLLTSSLPLLNTSRLRVLNSSSFLTNFFLLIILGLWKNWLPELLRHLMPMLIHGLLLGRDSLIIILRVVCNIIFLFHWCFVDKMELIRDFSPYQVIGGNHSYHATLLAIKRSKKSGVNNLFIIISIYFCIIF